MADIWAAAALRGLADATCNKTRIVIRISLPDSVTPCVGTVDIHLIGHRSSLQPASRRKDGPGVFHSKVCCSLQHGEIAIDGHLRVEGKARHLSRPISRYTYGGNKRRPSSVFGDLMRRGLSTQDSQMHAAMLQAVRRPVHH